MTRDNIANIFYMFAGYFFYDATLYNHRVNIYNCNGENMVCIYVYTNNLDGVEMYSGVANGSAAAMNTMFTVLEFLKMICDKHKHPEELIKAILETDGNV